MARMLNHRSETGGIWALNGRPANPPAAAHRRVIFLDELRGFTVISMVLFHASYDLAYIHGIPMPWFTNGIFQDVWRASISWTFLALAGWMTAFSRSNLKRAGVYGCCALAVWAATTIAAVDTPVNYGILFCMAASTLLYALIEKPLGHIDPIAGMVCSLAIFALTWSVPRTVYDVEHLAWLGFPSPTFASGDYYPLVPFAFMYLAGAFAVRVHKRYGQGRYPAFMMRSHCQALSFVGRHSLLIYLVHQPIIVGLLMLTLGA